MVIVYTECTLARSLQLRLRFLTLDSRGDDDTLVADVGRFLAVDKEECFTALDWCLEIPTQRGRRHRTGLNARDEAEARRDPIKFTGDVSLGPPYGWVLLWKGIYSNLFAEYVPRTVRKWGYVMWDRNRWDGLGDLAWGQWKTDEELANQIWSDFEWRPYP